MALARTLIHAADLLILDEPTNHIDHHTVEWLEEYLARFKGALILITHDRYFLDRVVNRIVELDQGYLYSYKGNYSYFLEQKANRIEQLAATEDKRQNLLRRELACCAVVPKQGQPSRKLGLIVFEIFKQKRLT